VCLFVRDRVLSLETDLCPRRRSGEWGKESSKVQEKRRMLVKEGVRYVPPWCADGVSSGGREREAREKNTHIQINAR